MNRICIIAGFAFACLCSFTGIAFSEARDPVSRRIFDIIQSGQRSNVFTCRGQRICGISAIPEFYGKREYAPAWTLEGTPTRQLEDLVLALESCGDEGLSPEIYHFAEIQEILGKIRDSGSTPGAASPSILAELDVLLTDAFLLYATHLRAGRVDPESIHTSWVSFLPEIDLLRLLSEAIERGRIAQSLLELTPTDERYHQLKKLLLTYRRFSDEGGWPQLPSGPTLRPGELDLRVPALRRILTAMGDLEESAEQDGLLFDDSLEQALRRFQRRHGLEVDGILGRKTLSQLNRPIGGRIRQLEINLERWRWLPHDLGSRYLLVNIADFRLDAIESGRSVLDMRVVVGSHYRKTPVFSETMKYIVLNPYWHVPFRIAVKDKIPLIQKDPSYLSKNGFRVFLGWEADAPEVPPESVDWSGITQGNFVYRLRQDPGPQNALGRIKFMFPNHFAVYLHDTPQQVLFGKTVRTFSSGCIRVEKPLELAAYVLQGNPYWTRERIEAAIASDRNRTVLLDEPIPVHLLYWTAWVEPDGTPHFREDIYERDVLVDRALREVPPKPALVRSGSYQ